jgi:dihydroorotase-like cyclic amidohydrolase
LFDPDGEWRPSAAALHSRQRSTPFINQTMRGVVRSAVVRGRVVFDDGRQADDPAGRFLRPSPLTSP